MKVVILCGGKGIRAFPFTKYLPKPMLPLAGSPIIVQVIRSFVKQGFNEFILAAGYRISTLEDYFEKKDIGAKISIVDTGDETDTGGRVMACRDLLDGPFIVTYADGLCSVPLHDLLDFHHSHDGLVTITSVPMYSQYGVLNIDACGKVESLREKPLIEGYWINAGFIAFKNEVLGHWEGENLEREVLPNLVRKNFVYSYRHSGFFKSMDSYKDLLEFEELLEADCKPWEV